MGIFRCFTGSQQNDELAHKAPTIVATQVDNPLRHTSQPAASDREGEKPVTLLIPNLALMPGNASTTGGDRNSDGCWQAFRETQETQETQEHFMDAQGGPGDAPPISKAPPPALQQQRFSLAPPHASSVVSPCASALGPCYVLNVLVLAR